MARDTFSGLCPGPPCIVSPRVTLCERPRDSGCVDGSSHPRATPRGHGDSHRCGVGAPGAAWRGPGRRCRGAQLSPGKGRSARPAGAGAAAPCPDAESSGAGRAEACGPSEGPSSRGSGRGGRPLSAALRSPGIRSQTRTSSSGCPPSASHGGSAARPVRSSQSGATGRGAGAQRLWAQGAPSRDRLEPQVWGHRAGGRRRQGERGRRSDRVSRAGGGRRPPGSRGSAGLGAGRHVGSAAGGDAVPEAGRGGIGAGTRQGPLCPIAP